MSHPRHPRCTKREQDEALLPFRASHGQGRPNVFVDGRVCIEGGEHIKKPGECPAFLWKNQTLWLGGRLSGRRRTRDFLSFDQAAGEIKSAFFLDRL